MEDLLSFLVHEITGSEKFEIDKEEEDGRVNLTVKIEEGLAGLIIGKGGRTIKAIRNLLKVRAIRENKIIHLEISAV